MHKNPSHEAPSQQPMPAGIFINYRRQDALHQARAIYERLRAEFGQGQVFIDLEGLDYGEDFEKSLARQLQHCRVLLALIGPGWLDARDGHGHRRLDDENDFVRIELRAALARDIRVVPVLLDGALLPRSADLPEELRPLLRRHALELRFQRFDADIGELVKSLRRLLQPAPVVEAEPPVQAEAVRPPAPPPPALEPATEPVLAPTSPKPRKVRTPKAAPVEAPAPSPAEVSVFWSRVAPVLGGLGVLAAAGWQALKPAPAPAPAPASSPAPVAAAPQAPASVAGVKLATLAASSIVLGKAIPMKVPVADRSPGTRFRDCEEAFCPWAVVLPAGEFLMGSPASEAGRSADEGPQHRVKIAYKLAMMETEVTVGQFKAFAVATGYKAAPACDWRSPGFDQSDAHPVVCVSWQEATAFAKWLAGKTGQAWRLPSEAEWEYAARAGTVTPFAFGDRLTTDQANFDGRFTDNGSVKGVYRGKTLPAGQLSANAWKLYDLHGNAWEWVQDCWHDGYQGAPADGSVWGSGCKEDRRVLRGGGWFNGPDLSRAAIRGRLAPDLRYDSAGFRLARTLTP